MDAMLTLRCPSVMGGISPGSVTSVGADRRGARVGGTSRGSSHPGKGERVAFSGFAAPSHWYCPPLLWVLGGATTNPLCPRMSMPLPILLALLATWKDGCWKYRWIPPDPVTDSSVGWCRCRSEEHTSELQSRENLVCRLLLEKKKGRSRL